MEIAIRMLHEMAQAQLRVEFNISCGDSCHQRIFKFYEQKTEFEGEKVICCVVCQDSIVS